MSCCVSIRYDSSSVSDTCFLYLAWPKPEHQKAIFNQQAYRKFCAPPYIASRFFLFCCLFCFFAPSCFALLHHASASFLLCLALALASFGVLIFCLLLPSNAFSSLLHLLLFTSVSVCSLILPFIAFSCRLSPFFTFWHLLLPPLLLSAGFCSRLFPSIKR